jgi:ATP-dependent DNA helicase RecG
MPHIDMGQLVRRESEQVEWKETVADVDDVTRAIVAFANDLHNVGGGYVVCGAAETKDAHGFQAVRLTGLGSARLREIEGKVVSDCTQKVDPPLTPLVEVLDAESPDRRVLVFIVPRSERAHAFRASPSEGSVYFVRADQRTIEARNGVLRELLVRKQVLDPWDLRAHPTATVEDLDLLSLREYLARMGLWDARRPVEDYLAPENLLSALAPPLCKREPLTGTLRPLNHCLLLFGREVQRWFPSAHAIVATYPGSDRGTSSSERLELTGTIVAQAERLMQALSLQETTAIQKSATAQPHAAKYPARALQEAVVNAIVHRDYESAQPVMVTVFVDRVEIHSPGPLPREVDRDKFVRGQAHPHWRNRALAYFFFRLGLAQALGQGIPTIIHTMKDEGCPPPSFELGTASVTCVLPAHPRHALFRELREIEALVATGDLVAASPRALALALEHPALERAVELFLDVGRLRGEEVAGAWLLRPVLESMSPRLQAVLAQIYERAGATEYADALARRAGLRAALSGVVAWHVDELESTQGPAAALQAVEDEAAMTPFLAATPEVAERRGSLHIACAVQCLTTLETPGLSSRTTSFLRDQAARHIDAAARNLDHLGSAPSAPAQASTVAELRARLARVASG